VIHRLAAWLRDVSDTTWVILITLVGLALRLTGLGAHSLWFDEAFSWLVAQEAPWTILTERPEPILPPLYHLLLHFWIVLGESETALRSLSMLFGVLTIPLLYALGRELFGASTGLGAALGTATLPFQVYFSQEARLYSMVILLSALMLYAFVRAWRTDRKLGWIWFGLLAGLNCYAHYFVVFALAVLHAYALTRWRRELHRWRGLLLGDLVGLAVVGPLLPSAWAQAQQVTSSFWLSRPSPLELVRTLDYLLFGHTTPIWLVPAALFLTLCILVLVAWISIRVRRRLDPWVSVLLALVLGPMLLALLLSWIIAPVYLDRSFSLVTPAYLVLLSWGFVYAPRRSPLRLLYGGLALVAAVSLCNHYLTPDPAKPPFRQVGLVLKEHQREDDILLHLHDSSYLPLRYYAPQGNSYLLNNDPDAWLPPYTWAWAGLRITSLDEIADGGERLWVVIMPARLTDRQRALRDRIEARYSVEREWTWPSTEPITIRRYGLADAVANPRRSVSHSVEESKADRTPAKP
jgi:hypothetical protein